MLVCCVFCLLCFVSFVCFTRHHAIQAYGIVEVQLHTFLTSELSGDECQLRIPGALVTEKMSGYTMVGGWQTRSQRGVNGCTAPTTDLDAPTTNLQYIRDKHADQPAKDVPHLTASTCCLLNLRGCKQLTVKNVCIYRVFCVMLYSALCN